MNFADAIANYEEDHGIQRPEPDLHFDDLFPPVSKMAAEVGSPAVLRLKRKNEKRTLQDQKAAQKIANESIPAFFVLVTKLRRKYVKSEISDRELVKLLIALVITVLAFIGRKKQPPQVPLWGIIGALTLVNVIVSVFW